MKIKLLTAVLSSFLCVSATAGTLALNLSNVTLDVSSGHATLGWSFSVLQNYNVIALDFIDPNGANFGASHQVGIWSSVGTLLASATIPMGVPATTVGSGNQTFASAAITPLLLTPGNLYYIGGTQDSPDKVVGSSNYTSASGITIVGKAFIVFNAGLAYPGTGGLFSDSQYFSPNFEFTAVPTASGVPEPASVLAVAGGLVLLALSCRSKT